MTSFQKHTLQFAILITICIIGFLLLSWESGWQQTIHGGGTNISADASSHWAWNDAIGWIDFYSPATIIVANDKVSGYASSSVGTISLDCATTPRGDICGSSNYEVANNGSGRLSGYAWNDSIGWISFCNNQPECPGSGQSHQVVIDGTTGDWSGYAWNDVVGWISFNCINTATCDNVDYKVVTSWTSTSSVGWLESATYDTGVTKGAQINSILWRGELPSDTSVRFQMAFSNNSSGPWNFSWDNISSTSPAIAPNVSLPVDYAAGANKRYFRYRVYLYSDIGHTATPRVDDIIINWSR